MEILRLLYLGARILVFDEPTAVLTPQEARNLLQTLRGMAAQGFSVVFISHKLDEVLEVADRSASFAGVRSSPPPPGETDRRTLARLMVGRELAGLVEHPTDEPHEVVTTERRSGAAWRQRPRGQGIASTAEHRSRDPLG